jgi:hypothetical protein
MVCRRRNVFTTNVDRQAVVIGHPRQDRKDRRTDRTAEM